MSAQSELDQYMAVVADTLAFFDEQDRKFSFGEVQSEIGRRWAKAKARPFNEPAPPTPDGVPFSDQERAEGIR